MTVKRNIGVFLLLVFVLQLLPVRQVVNYFLEDNLSVEEIIDSSKSTGKASVIDEDQLVPEFHYWEHPLLAAKNIVSGLYKTMLPSTHTDDVETPPPNC